LVSLSFYTPVKIYGWQNAGEWLAHTLGTGWEQAGHALAPVAGGALAERWQLDAIWLAYANFQPRWLGDGCL